MKQIKIFIAGKDSDSEGLEKTVNEWLAKNASKINVTNIIPMMFPNQGGWTQGFFLSGIIVLYEEMGCQGLQPSASVQS